MRWHVELNEQGKPLYVDHVETLELARETASGLVRDLKGKGLPEEQVSGLFGDIQQLEPDEVDIGAERTWRTDPAAGADVAVTIGALPEGETDEDCPLCSR